MKTHSIFETRFALARPAFLMAIAMALGPAASAHIIQNNTNYVAICAIYDGDSPSPLNVFGVAPNATHDCVAGTPCNPNTQFNYRYTLRVSMSHTYGIYEANIPLEVGGTVRIRSATRPWTLQPDIHMQSFDTFGAFIGETYPNFGEYSATSRNVQFIGTADCQYFHFHCCNAEGEVTPPGVLCGTLGYGHECPNNTTLRLRADAVHSQIREEFSINPLLRGAIIAGDLVQSGHPEEWNWYLNSFTEQGTRYSLLPYIFDGLGNHDYDPVRHPIIRDHVREHSRNTVRTLGAAAPVPHYSWDWHDVHFVQLNVIPSDFPPSGGSEFFPYGALSFLAQDLQLHVGSTGRPVFIIHHFGLNEGDPEGDEPSWWDPQQKVQYWNVIASYNVRGIIHGHSHLNANHWGEQFGGRWGKWWRPDNGIGGPDWIRTFNVSSSRDGGVFCEMEMGPNNSITLRMRDQDGILLRERMGFNFENDPSRAVYVAPGPAGSGDGDIRYPWTSVQNSVNAVMTYPNGILTPVTPIRVAAGTYSEPVTVNISRQVRLEATGGLVRIGQP